MHCSAACKHSPVVQHQCEWHRLYGMVVLHNRSTLAVIGNGATGLCRFRPGQDGQVVLAFIYCSVY
jgi:hypothetical protein